jgi:hypothetical protein
MLDFSGSVTILTHQCSLGEFLLANIQFAYTKWLSSQMMMKTGFHTHFASVMQVYAYL